MDPRYIQRELHPMASLRPVDPPARPANQTVAARLQTDQGAPSFRLDELHQGTKRPRGAFLTGGEAGNFYVLGLDAKDDILRCRVRRRWDSDVDRAVATFAESNSIAPFTQSAVEQVHRRRADKSR